MQTWQRSAEMLSWLLRPSPWKTAALRASSIKLLFSDRGSWKIQLHTPDLKKKPSLNVQNLPLMLIFQVSFSRFRCTQMVFPRFLSSLQCTFAFIPSVYGSIWMSATVGTDRESCYILPPPLQQPIVQHQVLPLNQSELRRALTDRDSESSLNC